MTEETISDGTVHKMPADFRKALISTPRAKGVWEAITPLARNEWICWITFGGAGLSSPPDFLVEKDIEEGRLVEVLPEWQMEPLNVYAIWPKNLLKTNLASQFKQSLLSELH